MSTKSKPLVASCPKTVETVAFEVSCKRGALNESGLCVVADVTDAKATCAKGYKMENDACIRISQIAPIASCPNGGTLKNDAFEEVVITQPELSCPKGFTIANDGQCSKTKVVGYLLECPNGYKLVGGVCQPLQKQYFVANQVKVPVRTPHLKAHVQSQHSH